VEAEFNIIAREGGFRQLLRSFDLGVRTSFDLEIKSYYGITMWLRVTPVREEVNLNPRHQEVYLINRGEAVFITEEDGEEILDKPPVVVWASINTAVHVGGMPAGTLKMWEHVLSTQQLGA
jgi:hypothetical protein